MCTVRSAKLAGLREEKPMLLHAGLVVLEQLEAGNVQKTEQVTENIHILLRTHLSISRERPWHPMYLNSGIFGCLIRCLIEPEDEDLFINIETFLSRFIGLLWLFSCGEPRCNIKPCMWINHTRMSNISIIEH